MRRRCGVALLQELAVVWRLVKVAIAGNVTRGHCTHIRSSFISGRPFAVDEAVRSVMILAT